MSLLFISREREYHLAVARFFFWSLRPISREGRALAPGNVTVAFTERFATGSFVTSNWRRRYSECTCGTMNSDPPATLWRARRRSRRGGVRGEKRVQRGGGRTVGLVTEAGERPSCWYFGLQSDADILRRHWHCDRRSAIASHQQRSVTTMRDRYCGEMD